MLRKYTASFELTGMQFMPGKLLGVWELFLLWDQTFRDISSDGLDIWGIILI